MRRLKRRPTWRLTLRFIALLIFVVSLIWLIVHPDFDPLLAWLEAVSVLVASFFVPDKPVIPTPETTAKRNRQWMLELVKTDWIKGVLDNSLHNQVFIDLGIKTAVKMVLRPPNETERTLPEGTKIADVFNQQGRELLILGEPGSGKTTTMLELAQTLIDEAETDDKLPMPVVFNLSSWANERKPLSEWLVDELWTKYQIPRKVAEAWVEQNEILPLLDGLDEVRQDVRGDCVEAINTFKHKRGALIHLVVCSRIRDYEAINTLLEIKNAIVLQPLTDKQIDNYLAEAYTAGKALELQAVRATLKYDNKLREMARTPLMLSVMTLAYRGASMDSLRALNTIEARRKHLFEHYVNRMFERPCRSNIEVYPKGKTVHYLTRLAGQMVRHSQTEFYIEALQLDCLKDSIQRRYGYGVGALVAIAIGLSTGLALAISFRHVVDWQAIFAIGFACGLAGGLFVYENNSCFAKNRIRQFASRGIIASGCLVGIAFSLAGSLAKVPQSVLVILGLFFWGFFIFFSALIVRIGAFQEQTISTGRVDLSREQWRSRLFIGLLAGLFSGITLSLLRILARGLTLETSLNTWLGYGLPVGGGIALGFFIVTSLTIAPGNLRTTTPNEGIKRAARNAGMIILLSGGFLGSVVGFFIGVARFLELAHAHSWQNQGMWLSEGLQYGLSRWFLVGLAGGVAVGVSQGVGLAAIRHYVLRILLWRDGCAPMNYAKFLDYAAERVLMYKVGGGYKFIHDYLQQYFAELYTE